MVKLEWVKQFVDHSQNLVGRQIARWVGVSVEVLEHFLSPDSPSRTVVYVGETATLEKFSDEVA